MRMTVLSVSYPLARVSPQTPGGAEQVLATLDKALVRAGHRSLVVAPAGSRCHGLLIPAHVPSGVLDENAKQQARGTFRQLINRAVREYSIDVVHMHGLDFPECLPEEGIPVVVSLHLPLSWYQQSALRSITPNIHLVCVSKSQAATAMPGVRIDRIIPNGIDLSQFHPSKRKSDYAVVMSRMCPEKGVHLAIEAAERAGVNLIIAGSVFEYREHREYFDSAIAPRLSSRIRFIGPVGGDRKAHLLAGARCLIVPSLAPETSSLVAMEALASATPVIAFPNGAMRELISFGRTGFLVDSVEEMAEAIGKAGQIETQTCRREAEQRFSSESVASHYFDLYSSVLTSESIPELQAA